MTHDTSPLNIDPQEVAKFSNSSARWWDTSGEFKLLHQLNPIRVEYIESQTGSVKGKRILDIGCGGGILSELLAQKGATVTGIDASEAGIETAKLHLYESKLTIDYEACTVESYLEKNPAPFDIIVCMEMLEHVPDPASILKAAARLLKPSGILVTSTLNRTPTAFLKAIVGAEYLLNLLPKGTHHYHKFIRPAELTQSARMNGLSPLDCKGLTYHWIKNTFELTDDIRTNYFLTFSKKETQH
jgi:2-polyprenyl-6-hydroxyphenyl methylase/3-demethylubiquinone-9 3-methyltransferase